VREHGGLTEKQLKQPFYYSRWFYCTNKACKTTLIMPDRFRVFRKQRDRDRDIVLDVLGRMAKDPFAGLDPYNPHSQHPGVDMETPPWDVP